MRRHVRDLVLQPRDVTILRGLLESRVMTLGHITRLYFEGRSEAAKKRVQKLKRAGLVGERMRKPYEPCVLSLRPAAFRTLKEQGALADYPILSPAAIAKRSKVSQLTLRHELEVVSVKAAITSALGKSPNFRLAEYTTWPLMSEFRVMHPISGKVEGVQPDSFLRIEEDGEAGGRFEHSYFIEVDRSHEVLAILANRAERYREYYRSGGFAERYGQPGAAKEDHPFRVLMIFKSGQRRDNVARLLLTLSPPVLTQVLVATLADVLRDPLGPIWLEPRSYRDSLRQTLTLFGT